MSDDAMKPTSRTDWERLAQMDDDDIDYSDIPPLTEQFFERAHLRLPNAVALDADVLTWFKQQGANYPQQINHILRQYIALHQQAA